VGWDLLNVGWDLPNVGCLSDPRGAQESSGEPRSTQGCLGVLNMGWDLPNVGWDPPQSVGCLGALWGAQVFAGFSMGLVSALTPPWAHWVIYGRGCPPYPDIWVLPGCSMGLVSSSPPDLLRFSMGLVSAPHPDLLRFSMGCPSTPP